MIFFFLDSSFLSFFIFIIFVFIEDAYFMPNIWILHELSKKSMNICLPCVYYRVGPRITHILLQRWIKKPMFILWSLCKYYTFGHI